MEALDFIVFVAGGWLAVIALAMILLTAASRADDAAPEAAAAEAPALAPQEHSAAKGRMPRMPVRRGSNLRVGAA